MSRRIIATGRPSRRPRTMAVNHRARWLGAIAVVLLVAAMVVRSGTDQTPATTRPAARPNATAKPEAAVEPPPDVKLDALTATRSTPSDTGRDPFRFRPVAPPPAPAAKRLPGIPDDQVDAPPPRPEGPPPPPPITLKFIGLVQKADGTKIAVLSDGKRPIHGTEGSEIEGQYRILKIGTESIEIAYIDGRGRRTIRLTGQ
jgi:hypothetical protein